MALENLVDLSMGIVRGQIAGGMAFLWHNKIDSFVNIVRTLIDWCIAIKLENREFVILNIHTPYECAQNEDEYMNRLGFVSFFIDEYKFTSIFVVGDMNADVSKKLIKQSLFAKHVQHFCDDNNLVVSSQLLLPQDSFHYNSEAWHMVGPLH